MVASKNPRLRLLHMRDEIENLSKELAGLSFETYRESYGLRRITERAIQIVSEAARALPGETRHFRSSANNGHSPERLRCPKSANMRQPLSRPRRSLHLSWQNSAKT
jgi:hypothetical protein